MKKRSSGRVYFGSRLSFAGVAILVTSIISVLTICFLLKKRKQPEDLKVDAESHFPVEELQKKILDQHAKLSIQSYNTINSKTKKVMSTFEKSTLTISIINLMTIVLVAYQIQQATKSLQSTSWQVVLDNQLELDNVFIEHPEMVPYFYDNKEITQNDSNYNRAIAVADLKLDFFDELWNQWDNLGFKNNNSGEKGWKSYIIDSFKGSSILRRRFETVACWYDSSFNDLITENVPDIKGCSKK